MNQYRTHHCGELSLEQVGKTVKLSGWVNRKRNHGSLLFIDLRDHYGITQIVFNNQNITHPDNITNESVITVTGTVVARSPDSINSNLDTGAIEVVAIDYELESLASLLPFMINSLQDIPEDLGLRYRFLALRKEYLHNNIILRSQIVQEIRQLMYGKGFTEFQTPILTASSPEGARDFLVPSRLHPGKFYALPQAPQQFKQLLMIAGFDKYFQIAPCFRDEDARADRSPGEFYQLDIEMSFVTQDDVFNVIEPVMHSLFTKFAKGKQVSNYPFPRITYHDALLKYGTDKPDLRNPITICDLTAEFTNSDFAIFNEGIKQGKVVRAIPAPGAAHRPRSFFESNDKFAREEKASGLAYLQFVSTDKIINTDAIKGPLAKHLSDKVLLAQIMEKSEIKNGDALFFICDYPDKAAALAGKVRTKLGKDLELINESIYQFCWIIDFPFYEWNEEQDCLDFSHNPFSMPQGGLAILEQAQSKEELLAIKAYQYDIVCNGTELSSGAIRNHKPEVMYKAFELAGYSKEQVEHKFGAMISAMQFGAPPHGGIAPGVDRIVMLLADAMNLREVIAFPFNQQAEDLLMNAPASVDQKQLQDLGLMLIKPNTNSKED